MLNGACRCVYIYLSKKMCVCLEYSLKTKKKSNKKVYQMNGIPGSKVENVSTRDDPWAPIFKDGLDLINYHKPRQP